MEIVLQILSTSILAVTAWIVWKYTEAAQKGNEIQWQPILNLYLEAENLFLANVGRGPAYNVSVEDIQLKGNTQKFYLDTPNIIIEQGGVKGDILVKTHAQLASGGTEIPDTSIFLFRISANTVRSQEDIERAKKGVVLSISYTAVGGRRHTSRFRIYDSAPPSQSFVVEFVEYK